MHPCRATGRGGATCVLLRSPLIYPPPLLPGYQSVCQLWAAAEGGGAGGLEALPRSQCWQKCVCLQSLLYSVLRSLTMYTPAGMTDELEGVEGNEYRDVWKASCWEMLQEVIQSTLGCWCDLVMIDSPYSLAAVL